MIVYKVIFDTNFLRDIHPRYFFGNRTELKKFEKVAEIIVPDIVLGEIENQIRRNLENKKKSFLENPFHWLKNLDENETKKFDTESHILELKSSEDIKFTEIKIADFSVLEKMKVLALKKQAPFEAGENTDKGFKDAYIYFTILEFLQKTTDKEIFVCTDDARLKEALKKHLNIIPISSYEEFGQNIISNYQDAYFIQTLSDKLGVVVLPENIIGLWRNINDDIILHIKSSSYNFVVEISERTVVSFVSKGEYDIRIFTDSDNYRNTHNAVLILDDYKRFFSLSDINNILEATVINSQIIPDEDVRQFISEIFEPKKDVLSLELKEQIEEFLTDF